MVAPDEADDRSTNMGLAEAIVAELNEAHREFEEFLAQQVEADRVRAVRRTRWRRTPSESK